MAETAVRRRIRRAVESRGFGVWKLTYERPYYGGEMEGVCGGWFLWLDRDRFPYNGENDLCAVTVDELIAYIDYALKPVEGCECPPTSHHPLNPLKGDPQRPLHSPECRWFLDYRLYWWPTREEGNRG